MTLMEEFKTRNFSIYGQWTGVVCIFLCFAVGLSNLIQIHAIIVWAIICLVCSPLILFIEVPLLMRICPTSSKFDAFIRRFTTNYMRAAIYLAMSAIQFSSAWHPTSLIAAAVVLLIAAIFYGLAGLKHQEFMGSKTLGGQGVAQMIV